MKATSLFKAIIVIIFLLIMLIAHSFLSLNRDKYHGNA